MTSFPPPPYKVELLQTAQADVLRGLTAAQRLGVGPNYAATMRRIYERLTTIPHTWGEPSLRYPNAKLVLRKMIIDRILVVFAVHEEQPVVFVRECRPIQGHPLQST